MSVIRGLVADAGVQPVVVVIVKIVGDAGLGPLAQFEHLRFESEPETFGLGVVVALAQAALRAHGPVLVSRWGNLLLTVRAMGALSKDSE